jgi:hypothetical protein
MINSQVIDRKRALAASCLTKKATVIAPVHLHEVSRFVLGNSAHVDNFLTSLYRFYNYCHSQFQIEWRSQVDETGASVISKHRGPARL